MILLGVGLPQERSVTHAYDASGKEVQTVMQTDLAAQINPEGLMISAGGFRRWIMGTDKDLGIPSSYFQTGVGIGSTPAGPDLSFRGDGKTANELCVGFCLSVAR